MYIELCHIFKSYFNQNFFVPYCVFESQMLISFVGVLWPNGTASDSESRDTWYKPYFGAMLCP